MSDKKIEEWMGRAVGRMHVERISQSELAAEMGVSRGYVAMVLNGMRAPDDIESRVKSALDVIVARKKGRKGKSEQESL